MPVLVTCPPLIDFSCSANTSDVSSPVTRPSYSESPLAIRAAFVLAGRAAPHWPYSGQSEERTTDRPTEEAEDSGWALEEKKRRISCGWLTKCGELSGL